MKILILFLFIVASCGRTSVPVKPNECMVNPNFKTINNKAICMESLKCIANNEISFSNYACFCDNLCICFFAILTNCTNIEDEFCNKIGFMTITAGDFCENPNKRDVLEELFKKTQEGQLTSNNRARF